MFLENILLYPTMTPSQAGEYFTLSRNDPPQAGKYFTLSHNDPPIGSGILL